MHFRNIFYWSYCTCSFIVNSVYLFSSVVNFHCLVLCIWKDDILLGLRGWCNESHTHTHTYIYIYICIYILFKISKKKFRFHMQCFGSGSGSSPRKKTDPDPGSGSRIPDSGSRGVKGGLLEFPISITIKKHIGTYFFKMRDALKLYCMTCFRIIYSK